MKPIGETVKDRATIILKGFDPVASKGFTQIPNLILEHPKLSTGAKLCYAMLLKYAWEKDFSFPGQDRLADDMGAGSRSVVRYIDELKRAGFITVKRQGLNKPNIYTLHATVKRK